MDSASVYIGLWRNHNVAENFPGSGLTLTLPHIWAAILISFVTLFVTATMANLWSIICFIIHQYRSTPSPRSGLYNQQQALLCNAPSTSLTVYTLLKLAWIWRGKFPGAVRLSLPLISTAIAYLALLIAAGLFSSSALLLGDEVLKKSGKCGWPTFVERDEDSGNIPISELIMFLIWVRSISTQAQEYVRNCYTPDVIFNKETCRIYTSPILKISTKTTAHCPFSSKICTQSDALEIDTGYINSNTHLGINTAKDDQFRIRTITTCAPILAEEKYSTRWSSSPPAQMEELTTHIAGNTYKTYNLGPTEASDYTWLVSNFSMLNTDSFSHMYELGAIASYADFYNNFTKSDFSTIEEPTIPQADTIVLFLQNSIIYLNATTDPWFRATSRIDQTGIGRPELESSYYADRVVSAIACTQQWEFCTMESCTSRIGSSQSQARQSWLERLSPKQAAVFKLLMITLSMDISPIVQSMGSRILRAVQLVFEVSGTQISPKLPSTQWQTEIINMLNIGLASTQRLIADYPTAPYISVPGTDGIVTSYDYIPEPEGGFGSLCSSIRFRDSQFSNFRVVGLIFILGFGLLIISTNLLLLPEAFFWLRRKFAMREYLQQEWQEGRLFMMQRSLLQGQRIGPWQVKGNSDIPWILELPVDTKGDKVII